MRLIRGLQPSLPLAKHGCVATIGNFDGVHLGHQALLKHLQTVAKAKNLPLLVILFEPQPREYFDRENAPPRLSNLREKLTVFRQLEIDTVWCLPFNQTLSSLSADDFMQNILQQAINVQYLVVGQDFRFGHKRRGDYAYLKQWADANAIDMHSMANIELKGARISSTRIRLALMQGQFDLAQSLLGRRYCLSGTVVHGDKRGRTLGFPTANITLHRHKPALHGVFAVQVHGLADHPLPAVSNVGLRPTVDGKRWLLEVHLLDFDQDIYQRKITVEFLKQLRQEIKFASLDALQQQLSQDIKQATTFFGKYYDRV